MTTDDLDRWCGPNRYVLFIHDRVYDASGFAKKHPGGNVINYLKNMDATEAFEAFHLRSEPAAKYLKNMPSLSLPEYYLLRKAYGEEKFSKENLPPASAEDAADPMNSFYIGNEDIRAITQGDRDTHNCFDSSIKSSRSAHILHKFREFHKQLECEGHFKPSYIHVAYRIFELIAFFILHFYLLSQCVEIRYEARGERNALLTFFFGYVGAPNVLIRWHYIILACIVGGISGGRAGWVQHEGGHASLTGNILVDRWIQKLAIGFGLICHDGKWNNMHNKHHAVPQKENQDPDLDTLPFLATYSGIFMRGRRRHTVPYMKWWIRHQHLTFFCLTSVINVFFWHYYLHPREYLFRKPEPSALFIIGSRYLVHFYVVYPLLGAYGAFITLIATMFLSGIYLFSTFSLNHTFMPTVLETRHKNWVDQQMDHTINIYPNIFVNWFMGYLNCQIEHHLFPNMPQFRQPGITLKVKAFCESVGIKYRFIGFFEAIGLVYKNLQQISNKVDYVKYDGASEQLLKKSGASAADMELKLKTHKKGKGA